MSDDAARARERALRLLAVRARSRREVEERLRRSGFSEEAVRAAVESLQAAGYLDDRSFARELASSRLRGRPVGRLRILHDLVRRGIEPREAEEALEAALESESEESELERAIRAARSRLGEGPATWDDKSVARMVRFLKGRGFTGETIRKALARLGAGL